MSTPPDPFANLTPEQKRALLGEMLAEKARQQKTGFPASAGQRALWYIHQTAPESSAYHVAFSAALESEVNPAELKRALQAVVNRHATLRTTYAIRQDNLMQEVHPYAEIALEQVDAAAWDDAELYRQVLKAYRQPFNLEAGPPARWHLFTRSPRQHVFLITIHHIAVDAWSLWIVLEDLRQALQAQADGKPILLAPPPPAYAGWSQAQAEMLAGPEGRRHQDYWLQQLSGELPALNLPLDYPRPALQTYHGASLAFSVPPEQTRQIRALAQAEGVTLYMLLLAAYQALLYRYTGQEDILIGTPTAGRSQAEYQTTVGYFVNPVTLRAQLSGELPFQALLAQAKQMVIGALAHQEYPFIHVVENLRPRQDPSRSPIFQCLFNLHNVQRSHEVAALLTQNQPGGAVNFGGLRFAPYFFPQEEGQFELSLEMVDTGDSLLGTLRYRTDLLAPETAARLEHSFQLLLSAVLANPATPLAQLPVLTPAQRQQILEEWNQTAAEYPQDACLQQLIEAQVERTPEAVALVFDDQTLSYRQLNQRANQLAHHLRGLGLGPEAAVGVYLERSPEMLIALLGVLKAGAAYVPMDPIFPPQRIQSMIEDSQMPVLITQQALLHSLPAHAAQCIVLDESQSLLAAAPTTNPAPLGGGEALAYVIFTSGSTGRPKGVAIPQRALVNFLLSMQRQPGLQAGDVLASVTTLSFDIAGLELYLPLICGARVVILSSDTAADGFALAEALDHHQATCLQATPATWRLLVETGWRGRPGLKMLCGGEPLPLPLAQQLLQRGGQLWNLYGPTETTIWSTLCRVGPADPLISIGRPIANTQAYILDRNLQPTPVGVVGALHLGGAGLARGYLNQPQLTTEKFIAHPFQSGARLYNTGDLARYLPDGRIECLGREDAQVKIRGFRIELGEIEAVLRRHPAIQHAVVTAREDTPGNKRLVAYYTAAGSSPTPRELNRFLRDSLPAYMIPAAYVPLPAFPQTPNGKIDRRALPAPVAQSGPAAQPAGQPPTTPGEQLIAGIWQELLQVERVSVFDNFFDLGGHSLLAMRVVALIRERSGARIDPVYLRIESLGQLAARLEPPAP